MIHSISIQDPFQFRHTMMMILSYFLLTILILFFYFFEDFIRFKFHPFAAPYLAYIWEGLVIASNLQGSFILSYGHGGDTSHLLIRRFDWGGLVYLPYATVDNITLYCLLFSHQLVMVLVITFNFSNGEGYAVVSTTFIIPIRMLLTTIRVLISSPLFFSRFTCGFSPYIQFGSTNMMLFTYIIIFY